MKEGRRELADVVGEGSRLIGWEGGGKRRESLEPASVVRIVQKGVVCYCVRGEKGVAGIC